MIPMWLKVELREQRELGTTEGALHKLIREIYNVKYIEQLEPGTRFTLVDPCEFGRFPEDTQFMKLSNKNHLNPCNVYSVHLQSGAVWQGDVAHGVRVVK